MAGHLVAGENPGTARVPILTAQTYSLINLFMRRPVPWPRAPWVTGVLSTDQQPIPLLTAI